MKRDKVTSAISAMLKKIRRLKKDGFPIFSNIRVTYQPAFYFFSGCQIEQSFRAAVLYLFSKIINIMITQRLSTNQLLLDIAIYILTKYHWKIFTNFTPYITDSYINIYFQRLNRSTQMYGIPYVMSVMVV